MQLSQGVQHRQRLHGTGYDVRMFVAGSGPEALRERLLLSVRLMSDLRVKVGATRAGATRAGTNSSIGRRCGVVASLVLCLAAPAVARQPAPAGARYSERDVWVGAPEIYGGPVYFPDEMLPLADAVAELLARPELGGYRVVPLKDVRKLWSDAQAGHLPGLPARCDAAPPPARLARHIYLGSSMADLRVDCPKPKTPAATHPACILEVKLLAPRPTADDPDHLQETATLHAQLPFGEAPTRWAERLRAAGLARGPGLDLTGGIGIVGTLSDGKRHKEPPFRLVVSDVTVSGDWHDQISEATFKDQAPALDACTRPKAAWRDNWEQPYVIEVDQTGRVGRCEFLHVDHLPRPEFPCVCDALRSKTFGVGAPRRRAMFALEVKRAHPPFRAGAALVGSQASDASAALGDGALDEDALAACLSPIKTEVNEPELPVRFSVGADGHVKSHTATWPRSIPAGVRRCMDAVLARSQFNCPLTGASTVDAKLQVFVTR
jgi:hypothetical protein